MQLVHGGDWAGYRAEFGRDALDFSANVSPLGLPEGVAQAITAALPTADRYPDPLCRELRARLALHEGVPAEQILCGNGAADLIFRLVWAQKPRRALVTAPTFAEYATALESVGCTVERFFLREQEDFAVTDAFCAAIRPGVDMVFLCQPNNPTGQLTALPLVEQILHRCAACGTLLVVDECFLDFLPDHALHTAKGLLGEGDLVILKAFTKLYGMAGAGLCPECRHGAAGTDAGLRPALGCVQSGAGGRPCRAGGDGVCGKGPGHHCRTAAPPDGRAAGAGPAGAGQQSKLPAVSGPGDAGRSSAAKGRCAAQLCELPRAGPRLVPHCRAHRA